MVRQVRGSGDSMRFQQGSESTIAPSSSLARSLQRISSNRNIVNCIPEPEPEPSPGFDPPGTPGQFGGEAENILNQAPRNHMNVPIRMIPEQPGSPQYQAAVRVLMGAGQIMNGETRSRQQIEDNLFQGLSDLTGQQDTDGSRRQAVMNLLQNNPGEVRTVRDIVNAWTGARSNSRFE